MTVEVAPQAMAYSWPLAEGSLLRPGGALARWEAASQGMREQILTAGFATTHVTARESRIGAFYQGLVCEQVPVFITVEALSAVSFLAVEAAFTDAEQGMLRAMRTLLQRLDARLAAAEPGAQPDLTAGLHVAEAVVAVGLSLLDGAYVAPGEVSHVVAAELALVRGHAGLAASPILEAPLDYAVFAPRGALPESEAASGPYLAAQWLAGASFVFGASETSHRVDMGAARARTRAALLVARLLMTSSDADPRARSAALDLDRLGELAFGDTGGTSPAALARFALANGFDLHDASAIAGPASLDRMRRAAATALWSMELIPLRRAPEAEAWRAAVDGPLLREPRATDVTAWLESPAWKAPGRARHASFYASALDAVSMWLAPSVADGPPGAATDAWKEHKLEGALGAWTLLRHGAVPYARATARREAIASDATACPGATTLVVVERHPEAIAALLGYVRQVMAGLTALHALEERAPSRDLLPEVQGILGLALSAAAGAETGAMTGLPPRPSPLAEVPVRLAAVEARVAPAMGPMAAMVYADPATGKALQEGVAGIEPIFVVVPDPLTGYPVLAVGAAFAHRETWVSANVAATDRDWARRLSPVEKAATDQAPRGPTSP